MDVEHRRRISAGVRKFWVKGEMKTLPIEVIRDWLDCDYEDRGKLTWRELKPEHFSHCKYPARVAKHWNNRFANKEAFTTKDRKGYKTGVILGRKYKAHRIVYAHFHGKFPDNQIDHINRDKEDNSIANLRDVTNAVNVKNMKIQDNNTSGCTGVMYQRSTELWVARIVFNGKRIWYSNKSKEIAIRWRIEMEELTGGYHDGTSDIGVNISHKRMIEECKGNKGSKHLVDFNGIGEEEKDWILSEKHRRALSRTWREKRSEYFYRTPTGDFETAKEAGDAHGIDGQKVRRWCRSSKKPGWELIRRDIGAAMRKPSDEMVKSRIFSPYGIFGSYDVMTDVTHFPIDVIKFRCKSEDPKWREWREEMEERVGGFHNGAQ